MFTKSAITESPVFPEMAGGRDTAIRKSKPSSRFRSCRECYIISLDAPGFRRENFDIKILDDILHIRASREIGPICPDGRYEIENRTWTKTFVIPPDADPMFATAKYRNDELIIIFSKKGNFLPEKGRHKVYVY